MVLVPQTEEDPAPAGVELATAVELALVVLPPLLEEATDEGREEEVEFRYTDEDVVADVDVWLE